MCIQLRTFMGAAPGAPMLPTPVIAVRLIINHLL